MIIFVNAEEGVYGKKSIELLETQSEVAVYLFILQCLLRDGATQYGCLGVSLEVFANELEITQEEVVTIVGNLTKKGLIRTA